ncbi:MAG: PatB family C-S lyase [Proteobacteria bacterium]|nr:PatB family C-S lyase [Pseudomonadota bacterium]
MAVYDFDSEIDRRKSSSLKWDYYKQRDVIPLWVADMDFKASGQVISALKNRVDHGVFGYTLPPDELMDTLVTMLKTRYAWDVAPSWIVPLPGVVSGLNVSCRAVGKPGDSVMVPVPVYPPFFDAPALAGKEMVRVEMVQRKNRLTFDWDSLENKIDSNTCLFLLCSPHNPGGTVFRESELRNLAAMAKTHRLVICSDEIHCGLVLEGRHIPTAVACPDIRDQVITLMAPSKTYNIPGLGFSFAIISDNPLREAFIRAKKGVVPEVNALGYTAALAAYRDSDTWLSEVLDYLRINRDLTYKRLSQCRGLSLIRPESTYLIWIDARGTRLDDPALFFEKAGVGLSDGKYFGAPGFLRLNFGCSRLLLTRALDRMERALSHL